MPESNTIQTIVQGGSVGVALALCWIVYKMMTTVVESHNKIADAHRTAIERNTDAWIKNTEATTKNTEAITQLKEQLK